MIFTLDYVFLLCPFVYKNKSEVITMKRKIFSIIFTTALLITMIPTNVLASTPLILHEDDAVVTETEILQENVEVTNNLAYELVIGNIVVTDSGYWTTDTNGSLTASNADNYNVAYDASTKTLILNNATIKGDTNANQYEVAIYIKSKNDITFNIKVSGNKSILSNSIGIYIDSDSAATLNIDGSGTLAVDSFQNAIRVVSKANATLNIKNINLNAKNKGYFEVIRVLAGANSSSNLTMDGSNFTTASNLSIWLGWPNAVTEGTATFTLKNNARINVPGEGSIVYGDTRAKLITSSGSNGIIKEGNNTIYYGEHVVNKDADNNNPIIDDDETWTISDGATLTINEGVSLINYGTIAIEGTGKIFNKHKIDNYGTLPATGIDNMPPTITTEEKLPDGEVGKEYSIQFKTLNDDATSWAVENTSGIGNLFQQLNFLYDTGLLNGTPKQSGDYNFYLKAYNDSGSHRKHFTFHIDEAPTYKISVNKGELDFGTLCPNYTTPELETIIITSYGNHQDVNVTLPTAKNYTISAVDGFENGKAVIKAGEQASFSIVPKDNLSLGTYDETIEITGDNVETVNISVKFKVGHNLTKVEAKSATCTTDGNIEYYKCDSCKKYFKDDKGTTEINLADTIVKASGHSYGEPTWSWTSDTQAVATFKCKNGDDSQEFKGIMSSKITKDATCDAAGVRTYTAKVVFNGKEYSTTKDIEIAKLSCSSPSPSSTPYDDGGPFTRNECGDVFDRWGNLIYDAPDCVVTPKSSPSASVSPKPTTSTLEPIETEEVEETSEPEKTPTPSPTPSATIDTTPEVEVESESSFGFIWWIIGGIGVAIAAVVIYLIVRSRNEE